MIIAIFSAVMMLGGQAAPASTPAPVPVEAETQQRAEAAAADARADRQVCRRERFVGSNRPQRVCMTQREWDQMRDLSRDQHQNATREQPGTLPSSR